MKKLHYILLLLAIIGLTKQTTAQVNIDSLWSVWNDTSQPDTVRLTCINNIIRKVYLFTQPDTAFKMAQLQYDFAASKKNKKWMASALNTQGISFHIQGNYYQALRYYNNGLKIAEETHENLLIASSLNNIGIIHKEQGNFDKAIEYFNKSFKIKRDAGDKLGVANSLGNIGGVYMGEGDERTALDYFNRGLKILEEVGDKSGVAGFLNNIGIIFEHQGNNTKAMEYFERSLLLRVEIGDKRGEASSLNNIGALYYKQGDFNQSINYNKKALIIAEKMGIVAEGMSAARELYKSYKAMGDYRKALEMHELFIVANDSIGSDKTKQDILRQEYKYEYEKQHLSDSLAFVKEQDLKEIQHLHQLDKEQNQRYYLYVGIIFLLMLGGIVFRGYQRKKNANEIISLQKTEVENQKIIVEEKNQEILDSIIYAKRIQNAILPQEKVIKEHLKDSFILYKPKDIVAGDFYWLETVQTNRHSALDAESANQSEIAGQASNDGNLVLFAAADCTGHGVPGAMVSVVCNNGLNRSVREYGLTDPGEILDKTREIVIQEFEKSEEDVKDGMDIAICVLENNKLDYAGANIPLWIIRKEEIIETKPDKQPIGKFDNSTPFTTHSFDLLKGDTIYIFSDGYVDQFGGGKSKKFKINAFRDLLISIQGQSMQKQKELIDAAFEKWKENIEQVDDVCVIGVRI